MILVVIFCFFWYDTDLLWQRRHTPCRSRIAFWHSAFAADSMCAPVRMHGPGGREDAAERGERAFAGLERGPEASGPGGEIRWKTRSAETSGKSAAERTVWPGGRGRIPPRSGQRRNAAVHEKEVLPFEYRMDICGRSRGLCCHRRPRRRSDGNGLHGGDGLGGCGGRL